MKRTGDEMTKWIIDHAHSIISFEVQHMMVSKVRGHFDRYTAHIEADDLSDLTTAKIEFQFETDSINTRHKERDFHLRSADFFDVKNYPTIDFKSTYINRKSKKGHYQVVGLLTIKGITNLVTFDVIFGGKETDPSGVSIYGYQASTTINREAFGLTWNTPLATGGMLIGKEVEIMVSLELRSDKDQSTLEQVEQSKDTNFFPRDHQIAKHEIYELIANNVTDFIMIMNTLGQIIYVTPSFKTVLKYDDDTLEQKLFFEMIDQEDQEIVKKDVRSLVGGTINRSLQTEFRLLNKEGQLLDVEAEIICLDHNSPLERNSGLILVVMRDITERKLVKKAIYQLAFHDSLTELPNRRSLMNQLRSEVMESHSSGSRFSVFFIDLDNFKSINDRWGHDAGDFVLKETAKRITSAIRPTDVAARFGGDEFVVLIKNIREDKDAIAIADRLVSQFAEPIKKEQEEFYLSPSIGISFFPDHGDSAEELIKNADTALYYVKEQGKNNYQVFNQQMEYQSFERRILENALRQGIKEEQFFIEYQPKVNIDTNELIGMEALVRWEHPELGVIPPGKFIPLAEETGLIVPLGEWILRESCQQATEWDKMGYPPLILSVNVSVRQLEDSHFVEKVKAILEETKLPPNRLELEITESVLVNVKSTIAILKEIRELGVLISVDDFGTGYSSLKYIKDLPIDTIKIDRSFVKDVHINKESKEIAKALVQLANSIGLNAIAEGIELKEHVEQLSRDGYIMGQGYYYSKPLKIKDFEEYMKKNLNPSASATDE